MTVQHSTAARNAMINGPGVLALIDTGSLNPSGGLQLAVDSAFSDVVVTIAMETTAFNPPVGGSAAMNLGTGKTATYVGANKTVSWFRFINRDNVEVYRGTISGPTGTGDIRIASTFIQNGDKVTIPSYSYTMIP